MEIVCKKCNRTNYRIVPKGPHLGAYCSYCGSFIRWIPKGEYNAPMDQEYESWLKMITEIVEAENRGQDA